MPEAVDPLTPTQLRQRLARHDVRAIEPAGRRHAAVAVAVTEAGFGAEVQGTPVHAQWSHDTALLLTRRAAGLNAHAGQWAMPGGRIDDGETPEQAALRELVEEVGLQLSSDAICGRLDDYATRSGYVITPVVVWAGAARELTPNADEVASIHRIPASEMLRDDAPLLNHVRGRRAPGVAHAGGRALDRGADGGLHLPVPRMVPARARHARGALRPAGVRVEMTAA